MISRSTQSTAARVSNGAPGECAPHRYCRRAVLPRSVSRHRRVRRRSGGLSLVLAAVAVTASGCALSGHPGSTKAPRVLGEPKGTPLAVGQPAPSGTGELGARVLCHGSALLGGGRRRARIPPRRRRHGDRRHHQRWALLEGAARRRREHPTARAAISCPTRDRVHGGRLQRRIVAGERRRRHDERCRGSTWSPATSPQNALAVASVTCASPTDCTAIVSDGTSTWSAHSADFGQSWQQEGNLPVALPARRTTSRASPAAPASTPATSRPATATGRERSP